MSSDNNRMSGVQLRIMHESDAVMPTKCSLQELMVQGELLLDAAIPQPAGMTIHDLLLQLGTAQPGCVVSLSELSNTSSRGTHWTVIVDSLIELIQEKWKHELRVYGAAREADTATLGEINPEWLGIAPSDQAAPMCIAVVCVAKRSCRAPCDHSSLCLRV